MPNYFFHLTIDSQRLPDEVGTELADDRVARHEAALALLGLARDRLGELRSGSSMRIEVSGATGKVLGHVSLTFEEIPPDWHTPR